MTTFLHLSDLHLMPEPDEGDTAPQYVKRVEALTRAMRASLLREGAIPEAVFMTGDILDSSTVTAEHAETMLRYLVEELRDTFGAEVPVLIVPGNHDRRRYGLIRAPAPGFDGLRAVTTLPGRPPRSNAIPGVLMATATDPISIVRGVAGLDIPIVLNDSSFLDGGLIGAGGTVWAEDVLAAADRIRDAALGPVIWLLHHHLVPTPVTDLEFAGSGRFTDGALGWVKREGLEALSGLVSNVDHEELTMTALGAGTVLSSLHMLGRPVLVFHGHKHIPTARVLRATQEDEGDVAIVSAGSAGETEEPNALMSIWPSFNVVQIDRGEAGYSVQVEAIVFPPVSANQPLRRRQLVALHSQGAWWRVRRLPRAAPEIEYHENTARYVVSANGSTLDLDGHRRIRVTAFGRTHDADELAEPIDALPGAELVADGRRSRIDAKTKLPMEFKAGVATYDFRIIRGVARYAEEAQRLYGAFTPYEWIGLPNRRAATIALLEVVRAEEGLIEGAFASLTDLATGREKPMPLERDGLTLRLAITECPPRCLLRIYWRLPSGGVAS